MKKIVCKAISVIMCAVCIFSIVLCVRTMTEPAHGFLDFRDLALAIYGAVGIVSVIIAYVTAKIGWTNKE